MKRVTTSRGGILPSISVLELPKTHDSGESFKFFLLKPYWRKVWDFFSYHGFHKAAKRIYGASYYACRRRAQIAWYALPRVTQDSFGFCVPFPKLDWEATSLFHDLDLRQWQKRKALLQSIVYNHIYSGDLTHWENIPNEHVFAYWQHQLQQKPCPL